MRALRKKVYLAAGYTTAFFGPGRKEFNPHKPMRKFDEYLLETAKGTSQQLNGTDIDEGILGSFMPGRFINQANLPGFLPFMIPSLKYKPCTGVEGACGTGGRAIAMAIRSVLADISDTVFVAAFEIQNSVKSVYGADILAGAAFYDRQRKNGAAYFFPGIFSERAGEYYKRFGYENTRKGLAQWYALAISNARKNSKAQEYHNTSQDLLKNGMTLPNDENFLPYLNNFDCSKVSDGAASIMVLSEKGLNDCGINPKDALLLIGLGEAEGDIASAPKDLCNLDTTEIAVKKALQQSKLSTSDIGILEVHDCFTISGLLSLEAAGFVTQGNAAGFILENNTAIDGILPTNLSGGLIGFGHPTGASGVRQMVDLLHQLTGKAENQAKLKKSFGMMISMGGDDKTVTSIIVQPAMDA